MYPKRNLTSCRQPHACCAWWRWWRNSREAAAKWWLWAKGKGGMWAMRRPVSNSSSFSNVHPHLFEDSDTVFVSLSFLQWVENKYDEKTQCLLLHSMLWSVSASLFSVEVGSSITAEWPCAWVLMFLLFSRRFQRCLVCCTGKKSGEKEFL